jgi:hypothetical protein
MAFVQGCTSWKLSKKLTLMRMRALKIVISPALAPTKLATSFAITKATWTMLTTQKAALSANMSDIRASRILYERRAMRWLEYA